MEFYNLTESSLDKVIIYALLLFCIVSKTASFCDYLIAFCEAACDIWRKYGFYLSMKKTRDKFLDEFNKVPNQKYAHATCMQVLLVFSVLLVHKTKQRNKLPSALQ